MGKWMSGWCMGKWSVFHKHLWVGIPHPAMTFNGRSTNNVYHGDRGAESQGERREDGSKPLLWASHCARSPNSFSDLPTVFLCGYHNLHFTDRETEWDWETLRDGVPGPRSPSKYMVHLEIKLKLICLSSSQGQAPGQVRILEMTLIQPYQGPRLCQLTASNFPLLLLA